MCVLHLIKSLLASPSYLLQVKFEILLVSPQARGLKEGRTEVKEFSFCFVVVVVYGRCFFFFSFLVLLLFVYIFS